MKKGVMEGATDFARLVSCFDEEFYHRWSFFWYFVLIMVLGWHRCGFLDKRA